MNSIKLLLIGPVTVAISILMVTTGVAQSHRWTLEKIENRAFELIAVGDYSKLDELKYELDLVSNSDAAEARFSIQGDRFVWRIHGHANAGLLTAPMEYLVATEDKSYESLIVVSEDSLPRIKKIAAATKKLAGKKIDRLRIQFAWADSKQVHVYDLDRIIDQKYRNRYDEFIKALGFKKFGWASFNINHRAKLIPAIKSPATLIVSLQFE